MKGRSRVTSAKLEAGGQRSKEGGSWEGCGQAGPSFQRVTQLCLYAKRAPCPENAPKSQYSWAPDTPATCIKGARFLPMDKKEASSPSVNGECMCVHVCA